MGSRRRTKHSLCAVPIRFRCHRAHIAPFVATAMKGDNYIMRTKKLVTDAMLIAMYVVLSLVSINLGFMKITLDGLPVIFAAALFGPLHGLAVGLLGAFANQLLTYGFSATTLLWIIPAGARGAFVGLCLLRRGWDGGWRLGVVIVTSSLLVTLLNTAVWYVDSLIYGYYSPAVVFGGLALRLVAGVLTAIVYTAVLPPLLKLVKNRVLRLEE